MLLAHGAAIDAQDVHKKIPLMLAILIQSRSMVALLLAHRKECICIPCCDGDTPLGFAAERNMTGIIKLLLAIERSLGTRLQGNETSALLAATRVSRVAMIKELPTRGVHIDQKNT